MCLIMCLTHSSPPEEKKVNLRVSIIIFTTRAASVVQRDTDFAVITPQHTTAIQPKQNKNKVRLRSVMLTDISLISDRYSASPFLLWTKTKKQKQHY